MTPCLVDVRELTPEAGDGGNWALSAAEPCPTGEEHCEQATTNGHDAECNFLHDVLSRVPLTTAVIGD
jgi:hypothetical protein